VSKQLLNDLNGVGQVGPDPKGTIFEDCCNRFLQAVYNSSCPSNSIKKL